MNTFQEFLEHLAQEQHHKGRRERREEWIGAVGRLIDQIRSWLVESDPQQLLEVIPMKVEATEPGLGTYTISSLKIGVGDAAVQVKAVGRNSVGVFAPLGEAGIRAEGRVDVTDGVRKYILYRAFKDGQEAWYALDEHFQAAPLNRGRLEMILQDLLS